jgi:hypothetical protein
VNAAIGTPLAKVQARYDNQKMSASLFLIVNAVVVLGLILFIAFQKRPKPSGLNPQGKRQLDTDPEPSEKMSPKRSNAPSRKERSLDCPFQFNGHSWDAFTVLGVPAGSDRDTCLKALESERKSSKQADDFLDAAWLALERYFS